MSDLFNCDFSSDPPVDSAGHSITVNGTPVISGGTITYESNGADAEVIFWVDDGYEDKDIKITWTNVDINNLPDADSVILFMQGNILEFSGTLFIVQADKRDGSIPDTITVLSYTPGGTSYLTDFYVSLFGTPHTYILTRESLVYSLTEDGAPCEKILSDADGKSFSGVIGQSASGIVQPVGTAFSMSYDALQIEELATTYTVTYDGNGSTGGSVPVDGSSPYDENDTVTVLGNTGSLVKTGYTFDGWNTAADGSGTDYAPAATFQMPASNTTLYAQWAAVPLQKSFCRKSEKIFQRGF
jgi:uncharacterized repeat protein (TIGR02543 family)